MGLGFTQPPTVMNTRGNFWGHGDMEVQGPSQMSISTELAKRHNVCNGRLLQYELSPSCYSAPCRMVRG
jgi:hypothetical protein